MHIANFYSNHFFCNCSRIIAFREHKRHKTSTFNSFGIKDWYRDFCEQTDVALRERIAELMKLHQKVLKRMAGINGSENFFWEHVQMNLFLDTMDFVQTLSAREKALGCSGYFVVKLQQRCCRTVRLQSEEKGWTACWWESFAHYRARASVATVMDWFEKTVNREKQH